VTVIASVDPNAGEIRADFTRSSRCSGNLVHNAIKFSLEEGRVEIRVERDGDAMELTVKGQRSRHLARFPSTCLRAVPAAGRSPTRSGSASASACRLPGISSELHGGTITAQSAGERMGATFVVRMPVALRGVASKVKAERSAASASVSESA